MEFLQDTPFLAALLLLWDNFESCEELEPTEELELDDTEILDGHPSHVQGRPLQPFLIMYM